MNEDLKSINLFGIRIDKVDLSYVLNWIERKISGKQKFPYYIVVVNVAKLIKARKDPKLRRIINTADLVGADGVPLIWISKLLGNPIPGRVCGIDLMEELLAIGCQKNWSFFLLGAKDEVIHKVVDILKSKHPNLRISGFHHGYFSNNEEKKIVDMINQSKADILFIGFGTPKKEYFVERWRKELNVKIIHGVGGSFDVIAGVTKRAPKWMQKTGLEWFFRLMQEPRRMWRRYLVTNSAFVFLVIKKLFKYFWDPKKFE